MARKRPNVTAALAAQAKACQTSFDSATQSLTNEILVDAKSGRIQIELRSNHALPEIYDLSFLHKFPNISEPSAQALRRHAQNLKSTTRASFVRLLRRGFFAFLSQHKIFELQLRQIDRALWSAFLLWLDQPRSHGEPWVPLSRRCHLFAIVSLFKALASLPEWTAEGKRIVAEAPQGAYPAAERRVIPRQRLALTDLIAIKTAAENEVRAVIQRFDEADCLLAEGEAKLKRGAKNFRNDFALCFAALVRRYPDIIPPKDIVKHDLQMEGGSGSGICKALRYHDFEKIHSLRYPSSADLVPFVLLLAIATGLNPEQVLTLKLADVSEIDVLGSVFFKIQAFKGRANELQICQLPAGSIERISARYIFHHVERITQRLRQHSREYSDNFFIYKKSMGGEKIIGFGGVKRSATEGAFNAALHRFSAAHGLPKFGLAQIRPTVGDEYRVIAGAFAAAKALGHKTVDTTDRHYTSDETRTKDQLRIGQVQALLGRWTQSEGLIDPRSNSRGHLDKGAATPGFSCVDPYSAPIESQGGRGGLCQAYGECPVCPFARAHPNDPLAAAFYVGLRAAIFKAAAGRVAPPVWRQKWAPIVQALENLITTVPTSVIARMPDLPAPLPPVG